MKLTLRSFAPLAVLCLVLVHTEAETYTWTGLADGDWNNSANWDAFGLPPVDLFGSLYGTENTITINGGSNSPTVNIPTIPSSTSESTGTPLLVVKSGASLSLVSDTKAVFLPAQDKVAATVESGAELTLAAAVADTTREIFMSRTGGVQTYEISGTLNLDADNWHVSYQSGRYTIINLDGGTINFDGGTIFGARNLSGNFTVNHSLIVMDNGAVINAPDAAIRNTIGSEGGYTVIIDFRDEQSSFTFKRGRDFNSLEDAINAIGTVFTSSTFGNENLLVTDNGDGSFTIGYGIPVEPYLWSEATEYAGNWRESAWYGWFNDLNFPLISHWEHGYQYSSGTDVSSVYLFDYGMASWLWTSDANYPILYKFGANGGWYWYYEGGTPGSRLFYSFTLGTDVDEANIND